MGGKGWVEGEREREIGDLARETKEVGIIKI